MNGGLKTGAQLLEERANMKKQVLDIASDINLRKWCVEQAVKVCCEDRSGAAPEVSQKLYNFVTNKEKPDEA